MKKIDNDILTTFRSPTYHSRLPLIFSFITKHNKQYLSLQVDKGKPDVFLVKTLSPSTFDWIKTKRWDLNKLFTNKFGSLYLVYDFGKSYDVFEISIAEQFIQQWIPEVGHYLT